MCFSASASFGAGIVLSVIGVASVKKAESYSEIFFAAIPLLFAIQQISEGFLWLALSNPAFSWLQQLTTYTFLFFAQVLWPLWVPLSIMLMEKKEKRSPVQKILTAIGVLVTVYLGYCLYSYHVEAKIVHYHILYEQDYPASPKIYTPLLYAVATIIPPFLSGYKRMWSLGIAVFISYLITLIFYEKGHVISVWCFFASIISMLVFAIMYEINKTNSIPSINLGVQFISPDKKTKRE